MPVNNAKEGKKNERRSTEMKQMTGTGSTRHLKRSTGSMDPTSFPALEDEIHDFLLHNHSNLKTSSQRISAFDSLQQKPE